MSTEQISDHMKQMSLGEHMILFYDSPEHKYQVLFDFLQQSGPDQALAYICADETSDELRDVMRSKGIDVDALERSGRLTIKNCSEWYIVKGEFSAARVVGQWAELARKTAAKGYKSMRVTGETSCFFRQNKVQDLTKYEYSLHRRTDLPMEILCAYNVIEMSDAGCLDAIMPLVRAHDPVIFTGPLGSTILPPENVEDKDVERMMQVTI